MRQLQPFCVRGVNFNNLSTHSSRRLCALICARGPLSKYPKYILFTLYLLNKNRKSSHSTRFDVSAFDFLYCGKNSSGLMYLSSIRMREVENCSCTLGLSYPLHYNTCIIIYTVAGSKRILPSVCIDDARNGRKTRNLLWNGYQ